MNEVISLDLKPYPAYQQSGIEELGKVPAHWEVRRLGHLGNMRVSNVDKHSKEDEIPVLLCNYVDVYKNDRIIRGMPMMAATVKPAELARFRIREGDVLLTKDSEAWDDIGVPAFVEDCDKNVVLGYHLALVRADRQSADPLYVFRALQSVGVAYQFRVKAKGVTRFGLSHGGMRDVILPLPPIAEQAAIVRFLDFVDGRVGRLVEAKERLVGLLEELKTSVISEAVTGRIDVRTGQPYPAYNPSGIEYLGCVPSHWELLRLGALLTERGEFNKYLKVKKVLSVVRRRGVIPYSQKGKIGNKKSEDISRYKVVRPDDIVVNSMNVIIGSVGLSSYTGCLSPVYYVLARRSKNDDPRYLGAYFENRSFQVSLTRIGYGILAHRMRIPMELLKCEPILRPPREEQSAIAEYLKMTTFKIDTAVDNARREVKLLQEYRTRLISDVVTGRVDVREAADRLGEAAA